jgi:glycerol uptake facilitator-like aquaporin
MIGVFAIADQRNAGPPPWLVAPLIGALVVGIGAAFGFNAGYAINPARDFGPRLFTAVAGWGGGVFTAGGGWWWVPILGPTIGAVIGAVFYDLCVGRYLPNRGVEL